MARALANDAPLILADEPEDVADRVLWLADGLLADKPPQDEAVGRDPVCGMTVPVARAAGERVVGGTASVFCSELCLDRFDADPAAYTAPVDGRPAVEPPASNS